MPDCKEWGNTRMSQEWEVQFPYNDYVYFIVSPSHRPCAYIWDGLKAELSCRRAGL
jgi:hypothetical protein